MSADENSGEKTAASDDKEGQGGPSKVDGRDAASAKLDEQTSARVAHKLPSAELAQPADHAARVPDQPPVEGVQSSPRRPASTWQKARDLTGRLRRSERGSGSFFVWLRRTVRLWGFLAFVLIVLAMFRRVVLPFVLATLVAFVLAPVLDFLASRTIAKRRVPRVVGLVLLYLALGSLTALFLFSFVPRVSKDLKRIVGETPELIAKARREWVPGLAGWLQKNFGGVDGAGAGTATGSGSGSGTGKGKGSSAGTAGTGSSAGMGSAGTGMGPGSSTAGLAAKEAADGRRLRFRQLSGGGLELDLRDLRIEVISKGSGRYIVRAAPPMPRAEGFEKRLRRAVSGLVKSSEEGINSLVKLGQKALVGLLSALTTLILTFMISAFLLIDPQRILRGLRSLVDTSYHADFDAVVKEINRGLSGAIRGQLLICIVNAVLTWIGLKIFGVKYAFLLALTAGVMSLIPIFGSILSTIPIVLVALASSPTGIDLVAGVGMLFWIIGIHLVEANLLNPKIIGTAAKIHPVIVIFAVVAGERTYGAMGALLAVPIVSAVQAMFVYIRARVRGGAAPESSSASAS